MFPGLDDLIADENAPFPVPAWLRGSLAGDRLTPEQADRVLDALCALGNRTLFAFWDTLGPNGFEGTPRLCIYSWANFDDERTVSDRLHDFLTRHPGDPQCPADPGHPDTWEGDRIELTDEDTDEIIEDGGRNFAAVDLR